MENEQIVALIKEYLTEHLQIHIDVRGEPYNGEYIEVTLSLENEDISHSFIDMPTKD